MVGGGTRKRDPAPLGLYQRRRHEVASDKLVFVVKLISPRSVVVLQVGLGLQTPVQGSWSHLGLGGIFTWSADSLRLGDLANTVITR